MGTLQDVLITYGLHLMHRLTGVDPPGAPPAYPSWVDPFEALLGENWPEADLNSPLTSIFSRVYLPEQDQEDSRKAETTYLRPAELRIETSRLSPTVQLPTSLAQNKKALGEAFWEAYDDLRGSLADQGPRTFTAFYHLMARFAWALPNTYGEPGVSLFHQWKTISALTFASGGVEGGPADQFILIGGDIPGIQRMIYTITSKGAAKALRGRSLFIQLLGDAVVQRLLHEMELSEANVLYTAGGNFTLLAPAGGQTDKVLKSTSRDVNEQLLGAYEGDVALCLAGVELPASAVGTADFGSRYALKLQRAVGRQKSQRFVSIAGDDDGWAKVFAPQGGGGERARFCAVCQAELTSEELKDPELELVDVAELAPGETAPRACADCATFRLLAEVVGQSHQSLYLSHGSSLGSGRWQQLLHQLSNGWCYRFGRRGDSSRDEIQYVLNDPDFLRYAAHGFRFLANTTPRATAEDVAWWDETYPDQKGQVREGYIRSFELLAHAARRDGALERVGVLRMDVDSLGRVMGRGLPRRTMAATSALSAMLDRFFSGYLDRICQQVTATPGLTGLEGHPDEDLLYTIYAGGDDLFIVGAWHLLPLLAQHICQAFEQYVGENPFLSISAGITLESRRFPLYQAAARAGKALDDGAKQYTYTQDSLRLRKNAIHFLGQTVSWADFAVVREEVDRLVRLTQQSDVPRGLLNTLRRIYERYREDLKSAKARGVDRDQLHYGPWMWRQAYAIGRIAKRYDEKKPEEKRIRDEILAIQTWIIEGDGIPFLGLAARWAEYLTRSKEEQE